MIFVRVAALASLGLLFLPPVFVALGRSVDGLLILVLLTVPLRTVSVLAMVVFFRLQVLYLAVLWLVRRRPSKVGLALSVGTGVVTFGFVAARLPYVLIEVLDGRWGFVTTYMTLLLVAQVVLLVSAAVAFFRLERERGDTLTLALGVAAPLLWVLLAVPTFVHSPLADNPPMVAKQMRELGACAAAYSEGHPDRGFPASLADMGPEGEGCIGGPQATGARSGYRFTYEAGERDAKNRIRSYSIVARPMEYLQTGWASFYVDDTRVLRSTLANRAATAEDEEMR